MFRGIYCPTVLVWGGWLYPQHLVSFKAVILVLDFCKSCDMADVILSVLVLSNSRLDVPPAGLANHIHTSIQAFCVRGLLCRP